MARSLSSTDSVLSRSASSWSMGGVVVPKTKCLRPEHGLAVFQQCECESGAAGDRVTRAHSIVHSRWCASWLACRPNGEQALLEWLARRPGRPRLVAHLYRLICPACAAGGPGLRRPRRRGGAPPDGHRRGPRPAVTCHAPAGSGSAAKPCPTGPRRERVGATHDMSRPRATRRHRAPGAASGARLGSRFDCASSNGSTATVV